ncbi:MAG: type IV pilus biogenesis/stability protein PilW [Cocleimonas sp.]
MNKKNISTLLSMSTLLFLLFTLTACGGGGVKKAEASDYNSELGVRYLQQGRLKLADEKLRKSLAQNPNSAQSNHYFALLQERLGLNDKADLHFKKAVRITPNNPDLRNNYGSFLCKNNQAQASVAQFLAAINNPLYSTPERAYTNAGICLREAGSTNDVQAEKYFLLALEKKISFPSALLELAKLYGDQGEKAKSQEYISRYKNVTQ